jgi:hypothetical protein
MSEGFPKFEQKSPKEAYIQLAKELAGKAEKFPFSGLEEDSYTQIKADDEESPGYSTPIDEIIEKLTSQGIKVALGKNPDSGNVYILPFNATDVQQDGLFPRHLKASDDMDPELKKLVMQNKAIYLANKK